MTCALSIPEFSDVTTVKPSSSLHIPIPDGCERPPDFIWPSRTKGGYCTCITSNGTTRGNFKQCIQQSNCGNLELTGRSIKFENFKGLDGTSFTVHFTCGRRTFVVFLSSYRISMITGKNIDRAFAMFIAS